MAKTVQLEEATLRLQIWDTAGEPRYRMLAEGYIRDAEVAVVVYDVTKSQALVKAK